MSRSLYWKITVPFTLLVLVGLGVLGSFMATSARHAQLQSLRSHLANEARLVADASLPGLTTPDSRGALDALAKKTGREIDARVTIIARGGAVLGDTQEDPSSMEDHSSRPEVMQALASGEGQSTRYSTTIRQDMMYVAVPITSQGELIGVARVALPATAVKSYVNSAVFTTASTMAVAGLLVILAAALIGRMITRPLKQMTRAAQGIASGQLEQQIQVRTGDELGQLARAFNEMSLSLKKSMAAVSAEKTRLATVLSSMTDGVIITDSEGQVLLANSAAEHYFAFKEARAIGKPLIEVVHDHEVDEAVKGCLKTAREQTGQIDVNGRFLRVVAVRFESGKSPGALALFQDLTEMRSLQTMRREFVGNVSHELRTPLTGMKAIVETLQDGAINDGKVATDFLRKLDTEVDAMTQMVTELLELSRIEGGRAKLKSEPVDLNLLMEEAVARLSPQAERAQVSLAVERSSELPLVPADRERIRQVIANLVHNAIKFTPAGGKVTVEARSENSAVVTRVSDTGIGIPREDLPHVFERFYKADKSRSSGGTGLGLAIAKHTVQAHGGNIWVESEEGKGSTFSFSLPLGPH
ncbi:MAG: HAMP domain-containing protein [Chloroflexi bacterium]|nr:HAMP domain-containing protein [Chloroflexota bacterium]